MIRELYTQNLDINCKYNCYIDCMQNDDVILKVNVYDKSLKADLSGYNVRLKAFKRDQVPLIQNSNITIKDNVITIEANKQLTTTAGIVKAELQFVDKSTLKKKSTFFIEIKVDKSALNVDEVVSTPTCTLLEEIDNKLDQIENIGEVLTEAKTVRDDLVTKTNTANTAKTDLETATTNANNKKNEVNTAITNASNKIKEVNTSITNANNSKSALDTSKTSADASKTKLDTSISNANKFIDDHGNIINMLIDIENLLGKVPLDGGTFFEAYDNWEVDGSTF